MKFLFIILILKISCPCLAASDTVYSYFNKEWEKTSKEKAFYYGKIWQEENVWKRNDYWIKGNTLQMEGSYSDKNTEIQQGLFKWYNENGKLNKTIFFNRNIRTEEDYYYESGRKKAHITYSEKGNTQVVWDENGKELNDYILEKEAIFPGGLQGWVSYLQKNLNANVPAYVKAKAGIYTVTVEFSVDAEGNLSNVRAIDIPSECKPCAIEAVRVIREGPKWEPAIQDNKKVIYKARQKVSFQVNYE